MIILIIMILIIFMRNRLLIGDFDRFDFIGFDL